MDNILERWPETWYGWRKQIPVLSAIYRLIVPDLRGYGETDKPATGYDKRNMAKDIKELIDLHGYSKVVMIGHDRGARVTTRFAKDYPSMVDRICTMDNIPTRVVYETMNGRGQGLTEVPPGAVAKGYWFFLFNQVPDLPEALISGREEIWLRHWLSSWSYNRELFSDEEVAEYVKAYSRPGALRGSFNDYRAAPEDTAQDLQDADVLIECPILTMWGEDFELVGQMFDVEAVWKSMGRQVKAVPLPECGHLPQEEQPELVNAELLEFLQDWRG
eukprot:SAG11_NODE_2241_length_3644_cov_4.619182_2_plen_274_part_00